MSGMGWGAISSAAGQTANNRLGQLLDLYQFAKSVGDQQQMQKYIDEFRQIPNLSSADLKYAAQTMGVQPDVLASNQRQDQITALRQMQDIASKGGMDEQSIAANREALGEAARQNQASQQGITNRFARQGVNPGSGAQIAQRSGAAQASYNTAAMAGAENAANARIRALQAINSSGRLAGDIASDEEARMEQNRRARMERDRFNAGVRNAAAQNNAHANLQAAQFNSDLAQGKIDPSRGGKTALRNEQTGYERDFGNRQQLEGQNLGNFMDGGLGNMFGGKK